MKPSERTLRRGCARLLYALAHRIAPAPPEPDPEPPVPAARQLQNPWAAFRLHHSDIDWRAHPGRRPWPGAAREHLLVSCREAA